MNNFNDPKDNMNSRKNDALLIIGCGWLGKKLGRRLSSQNMKVYGTTRSESNFAELSDHGIEPVKLDLPVSSVSDIQIPDVQTAVISISPGRGGDRDEYVTCIEQLSKILSERNVQTLMYSSTSVYGNLTGKVAEQDMEPDLQNSNAITAAEGALLKYSPDAVILRLCGLYGEDRHPARYLAGRKQVKEGDAPVNLIHREDVIRATELVITNQVKGEIFNVCSDCHPAKNVIYPKIARSLGLEEPTFEHGGKDGKIISSSKIREQLGWSLNHPDPEQYQSS